jgi:hypothetical protein
MRKHMRMLVTAATVLGVALFGFATTGIAGLAGDLEAAAPKPAPATEPVTYEPRKVDCPLQEGTRERRKL